MSSPAGQGVCASASAGRMRARISYPYPVGRSNAHAHERAAPARPMADAASESPLAGGADEGRRPTSLARRAGAAQA